MLEGIQYDGSFFSRSWLQSLQAQLWHNVAWPSTLGRRAELYLPFAITPPSTLRQTRPESVTQFG